MSLKDIVVADSSKKKGIKTVRLRRVSFDRLFRITDGRP